MRWETKEALQVWGLVAFGLAVCGVLLWALIHEARKKQACQDNGGHVVEYNCRTTMHCDTHQVSKYNSTTTCYPSTSCDWRCDGLQAERP